jgi:DNA-binding transcriptional MerR regulator
MAYTVKQLAELDVPLTDIKRMLDAPHFDAAEALRSHRKIIELKKKRLRRLIKTIDKTIAKLDNKIPMNDEELYDSFSKEEMDAYAKEAKERWGNTDAYKQLMERTKHFTKVDWNKMKEGADVFNKALVSVMDQDPGSAEVQALVLQHYDSLRTFYEPNLEMYRNLGQMYVDDPRFTASYDKYAPGLARFLCDAIQIFCDRAER